MKKIYTSFYFYFLLSVLSLGSAVVLQPLLPNVDLLTKAGGLISLFASMYLFRRLLLKSFKEAVKDEYSIDCGVYDVDFRQVEKEAKKAVRNDYYGIALLFLGSLLSIFGDLI